MLRINTTIKLLLPFIICTTACNGLESTNPELLLGPRNFNPHPYREGGRSPPVDTVSRRGPVLFPDTRDTAPVAAPPPDIVPYADVARKQRQKLRSQPPVYAQANNINPRVYLGLADYAAKVLKKAATTQHNGYPDPSLAGQKKNYAFSYSVKDRSTGDDFSHKQSQNAKSTNGEYRVKLPDGRVQIVSYTADKNGYKADVRYAEGSAPTQAPPPPAITPEYGLTQIEVPQYVDDNNNYPGKFYKYQPGDFVTIYPKVDVLQNYRTIPVELAHYVPEGSVQIYPDGQKVVLEDARLPSTLEKVHGIEAQIGTVQRPYDAKVSGKFIGPALASYAAHNILPVYEGGVTAGPTVAPGRYQQVYVTTAKYSVAHLSTPRHQFDER